MGYVLDTIFRNGSAVRAAAAGVERLILRDEEREEFVEASGLVLGYLLGLPCFAFQPDVGEAVKMLRNSMYLSVSQPFSIFFSFILFYFLILFSLSQIIFRFLQAELR
jgi:hypothetical protein